MLVVVHNGCVKDCLKDNCHLRKKVKQHDFLPTDDWRATCVFSLLVRPLCPPLEANSQFCRRMRDVGFKT